MANILDYYSACDLGIEPDEPAPSAFLECPRCARALALYRDDDAEIGTTVTLDDCERIACEGCGAVYTEGATLAVVPERDDDDNLETWE